MMINTDADQIIVAEVGTQGAVDLPPIRYRSGGLEKERPAALDGRHSLEGQKRP